MNEAILNLISESAAPIGLREIAASLNCPAQAAADALEGLIAEGEVVTTKKGRYMTAQAAGLVRARIGFQQVAANARLGVAAGKAAGFG